MKRVKTLKKAIFPAAGLGTRFLPATKSTPKEMFPVVDKPLIQYAVEEAIYSGIDELIFIINKPENIISDHFKISTKLEKELLRKKEKSLLKLIKSIIPKSVKFFFIEQNKPAGLGHAINCAKELIQDEDFAVILADDLIYAKTPCLKQMLSKHSQTKKNILSIEHVEKKDIMKYGIIEIDKKKTSRKFYKIKSIVEKPKPSKAKSNLAVVGRYIFSSKILKYIKKAKPSIGNEIQITDAIQKLLQEEDIYGYEFKGKRFDCGSKIGYLKANVEYGLKHLEMKVPFKKYLKSMKF